jgi:predicted O-methyltransferase YrrM
VARANVAAAGLSDCVRLHTADGGAVLAEAPDASVEFVFLDAERPLYAGWWPDLRRVLAPRGLLVVDNVLSHADQVAELRALVDADPTVTQALAPTGAGALLVLDGA